MRHTQFHMAIVAGMAASNVGCENQITDVDLLGAWGGEHVSLQITVDGGFVEYDCAHGTITEVIRPDSRGRFEVAGTHVFEHGGPVRENDPPDEHPALYTGTTDGQMLTYDVRIVDAGSVLGPYTLRLGQTPRLFKCL